jgi:CheY-like chemotaxis protein
LVVEASADTREVLQLVLEDAGATVRAVGSVTEALAALDQRLPDLMVSDLAMPEQDGYTLLRALRQRDPAHGGQLPALALSAFTSPEDEARAFAAGFQAYLGKPLRVEALLQAIAALVGRTAPSA